MTFNLDNLTEVEKYNKILDKRLEYIEREYARSLWEHLYTITPRDTGAAAASWNVTLNAPDYTFDINKKFNSFTLTSNRKTDNIYISTGCPYMRRLNYGWSQKAPVNFIENCITMAKNDLNSITVKARILFK